MWRDEFGQIDFGEKSERFKEEQPADQWRRTDPDRLNDQRQVAGAETGSRIVVRIRVSFVGTGGAGVGTGSAGGGSRLRLSGRMGFPAETERGCTEDYYHEEQRSQFFEGFGQHAISMKQM